MGVVYLAERGDEAYQKQVAIKLLRPSGANDLLLERFHVERQILANLGKGDADAITVETYDASGIDSSSAEA